MTTVNEHEELQVPETQTASMEPAFNLTPVLSLLLHVEMSSVKKAEAAQNVTWSQPSN